MSTVFDRLKILLADTEEYTYNVFTVDGQKFSIKYFIDGPRAYEIYVDSIHPYDESDYHWAKGYGSPSDKIINWKIFYRGKQIVDGIKCDYKKIAKKCLQLDADRKIHKTGGIW